MYCLEVIKQLNNPKTDRQFFKEYQSKIIPLLLEVRQAIKTYGLDYDLYIERRAMLSSLANRRKKLVESKKRSREHIRLSRRYARAAGLPQPNYE